MSGNNELSSARYVGFDFDMWEKLARLDPVEFERQRLLAIARFVEENDSDRETIEALCLRIENMRNRNAPPMENLQWLADEMSFALHQFLRKTSNQIQPEADSQH